MSVEENKKELSFSQIIYNNIVEAQREIQNTRDAYDLEIQANSELNSILNQEIFNNQIKLKKCFSLQYEYAQFPRFDSNRIDWTFFAALREAETLHDSKCLNWKKFLVDFGAYCRQCYTENCWSIIDLLTYSTIPTLFEFFTDLEATDDFISTNKTSNTPNFVKFTDFVLEQFFSYEVIVKGFIKDSKVDVPLQNRLETLTKFTRSVFVWPPFIHFVHTVFSPIIKKMRSYSSSILTIKKSYDDKLLVNTTDCLIQNLLRELRDNIDLCPPEISYFLKSIQSCISEYIKSNDSNSTGQNNNNENACNDGLEYVSNIFYENFLSLIFTDPRRFFIIDAHNDNSLFKTDIKFDDELKKSSILFVKELIGPKNKPTDSIKSESKPNEINSGEQMPKYILIDIFDQIILETFEDTKENRRMKKTKQLNETLVQNIQIKQYHLFKVNLIKEPNSDSSQNENKKKNDDLNDFESEDENDDSDQLKYSFNAQICNNDTISRHQLQESLYNLIALAPPLPNKNMILEENDEKNAFINVIKKVLVSEVHTLQNENERLYYFGSLQQHSELFPKNKENLASLFKIVKSKANPNSRVSPSIMLGEKKKSLLINKVSEQLLNKRMNIRKEKRQINAVLAQESRVLYINLFREYLRINNNVNLNINKEKTDFLKNLKNYFTNEKCFPIDSPTCIELAADPEESDQCFLLILKFHDNFKKEIGNYQGAEEVIHNSFFRHLTYYSYLVAKPKLIAQDMALSARFVKCKAVVQSNHGKEGEESKEGVNDKADIIKNGIEFYLPKKVFDSSELIEGPRNKIAAALSSDDVPLKKVNIMDRAFKEVIDAFLLKRNDDIVEVIAYIIASLHATHFDSCYQFVTNFIYYFNDGHAKLEIFESHKNFFDLLSKVNTRLYNKPPDDLLPSGSNSVELSLFTKSLDLE